MRLPKLNIKTFTEKPTEWPMFTESFEAAVDNNEAFPSNLITNSL